MKILITGASGFIGNYLVDFFTSKGIEVIGIDINHYKFQKYKNYNFERVDVRDYLKLNEIVERYRPTHVIHLAYVMIPKHNKKNEDDIDVGGSKNIFIAANNCSAVKQFILFSSASIYGGNSDNPAWITEDAKIRPGEWVYAQNKAITEYFYSNFEKRDSLKVVIFRMCTGCGPSYFKGKGLVRLLKHSPIGLLVNGTDMNMQFIHEDDVKNLINLVVRDRDIEGVYNLAPDSFATTKELSPNPKLFIKVSEKRIKKIFSIIWKLRVAKISPTSVSLITYGIVVSPKKIMDRYNYKFLYSTKEAFYNSI